MYKGTQLDIDTLRSFAYIIRSELPDTNIIGVPKARLSEFKDNWEPFIPFVQTCLEDYIVYNNLKLQSGLPTSCRGSDSISQVLNKLQTIQPWCNNSTIEYILNLYEQLENTRVSDLIPRVQEHHLLYFKDSSTIIANLLNQKDSTLSNKAVKEIEYVLDQAPMLRIILNTNSYYSDLRHLGKPDQQALSNYINQQI